MLHFPTFTIALLHIASQQAALGAVVELKLTPVPTQLPATANVAQATDSSLLEPGADSDISHQAAATKLDAEALSSSSAGHEMAGGGVATAPGGAAAEPFEGDQVVEHPTDMLMPEVIARERLRLEKEVDAMSPDQKAIYLDSQQMAARKEADHVANMTPDQKSKYLKQAYPNLDALNPEMRTKLLKSLGLDGHDEV